MTGRYDSPVFNMKESIEVKIMKNSFFKGVLAFIIIVILFVIAWKLLQFAVAVVLPIAFVAFLAYVIYIAVTGKKV